MKFKVSLYVLAIGTFAILATIPTRAETNLRLLAGWTPNNASILHVVNPFMESVIKASNGEIKFQRSGPEVVPPFDQLQPLSAGVFDILFTTPAYHQAQTGVGNIFDAMRPDPAKVRESGLYDWANDYYRKRFGVVLLAVVTAPGAHFVLREPLGQDGTLKGRKIRSNASFEGLIRELGGAPINLSPTDAYAAMQKATIDGIAFPVYASADFKLYEVGKYMTRPAFGHTALTLMMNAKKFDSLPENLRQTIIAEGKKIEVAGNAAMAKVGQEQDEVMRKNGVAATNFNPEIAGKLEGWTNEGAYKTAVRSGGDDVTQFWNLVKAKGMLNQ